MAVQKWANVANARDKIFVCHVLTSFYLVCWFMKKMFIELAWPSTFLAFLNFDLTNEMIRVVFLQSTS